MTLAWPHSEILQECKHTYYIGAKQIRGPILGDASSLYRTVFFDLGSSEETYEDRETIPGNQMLCISDNRVLKKCIFYFLFELFLIII